MDKKVVPMAIILFLIIGTGMFLFKKPGQKLALPETMPIDQSSPSPSGKEVDYRASFTIFTHGTFRVFTAEMYHNLSADVFITADNPNVVHVKNAGVTWGDFFQTLPFKLSKDCLTTGTRETFCTGKNGILKFYINGLLEEVLLEKTINAGDQILISFGNENKTEIQKQLQRIPKSD